MKLIQKEGPDAAKIWVYHCVSLTGLEVGNHQPLYHSNLSRPGQVTTVGTWGVLRTLCVDIMSTSNNIGPLAVMTKTWEWMWHKPFKVI